MSTQPQIVRSNEKKPSLHQVAGQIYRDCDGDEAKARTKLANRLRRDESLFSEAMEHLAGMLIGIYRANARNANLRAVHQNEDRGTRDGGLDARGASNLMAYSLPKSMTKLGDATKDEVHEAFLYHHTMRTTHGVRSRWFELVWKAMKDDKLPVKKQLNETDLQNLERRARKDEENA